MSSAIHGHDDDILFEKNVNRRWNDHLPPLRKNYARLLSPQGLVEDVWKGNLEGALEARDSHHDIFTRQRDWDSFVQWRRDRALLDLPCSATKN